jgi:hypothetical protein
MRDPWESDEPTQQLQPEVTKTKIVTEQLPDSSKKYSVGAKPQSIAVQTREKAMGVAGQKQQQSKKVTPTQQVSKDLSELASLIQFSRENLIQGVIWAEILGKPKAKRRGR